MTNLALRTALTDSNVDIETLAERCGVHAKTVGRWLANSALVPHPKHRHMVATTLGVDETVLWPEQVRQIVKTGADREIVSVYPYRSLCPRSVWANLLRDAGREIWLAGYTNYFLWLDHPNLRDVLKRKARAGCRVRFLTGDPDSEVTRQREQLENEPLTVGTRIKITLDHLSHLRDADAIEARFSDDHIAMSVFRFDDQMIVTPHLAYLAGHDSPTLHLRRQQDDGLFDRFAAHVDALWDAGHEIWSEQPAT